MKHRLIHLFIVLCIFAGCHKKVATSPDLVRRADYGFTKNDDGSYLVIAHDEEALQKALHEIGGCPCAVQYDGDYKFWTVIQGNPDPSSEPQPDAGPIARQQ